MIIDSIQDVPLECAPDDVQNIQIHSHGEMLEEVFRLPPNVCVLFTAKPRETSAGHPDTFPWAWLQIKDNTEGLSGKLTARRGGVDYHIDPPWFLSTGVKRENWGFHVGVPDELTRYPGTKSVKDIGVSIGPQHQVEHRKSLYKGGQLIQNMKYSMEQLYWTAKQNSDSPLSQNTTQQLGIYDPTNEEHFENFKKSQEKWNKKIDLINWYDRVQFPGLGQELNIVPNSATTRVKGTGISNLDDELEKINGPIVTDDGRSLTVNLYEIIKKLVELHPVKQILINSTPCRVITSGFIKQDELLDTLGVGADLRRTRSLGQVQVNAVPSIKVGEPPIPIEEAILRANQESADWVAWIAQQQEWLVDVATTGGGKKKKSKKSKRSKRSKRSKKRIQRIKSKRKTRKQGKKKRSKKK